MNPHLAKASEIYEKQGVDLQKLIGWHLCHGVVICNPFVFALCYHADSQNPLGAVEFHHSDTLFVTFCTGDMRVGISPFVSYYQYLAFQRSFKGSPRIRLLDMRQFFKKLTN